MFTGNSEECMKVIVGEGCGGEDEDEVREGRIPGKQRGIYSGGAAVWLGKSGTGSKLLG